MPECLKVVSRRELGTCLKILVAFFILLALGAGHGRSKEPLTPRQVTVQKFALKGGFHSPGACALISPKDFAFLSQNSQSQDLKFSVSCPAQTAAFELLIGPSVAALAQEIEAIAVNKLSFEVSNLSFDQKAKRASATLVTSEKCDPKCSYIYDILLKNDRKLLALKLSQADYIGDSTLLAIERLEFDGAEPQNNLVILDLDRSDSGVGRISRTELLNIGLLDFPSGYMPELAILNDGQSIALFKAANSLDGTAADSAEIWLLQLPGPLDMNPLWGYFVVAFVVLLGVGAGVFALMQKPREPL